MTDRELDALRAVVAAAWERGWCHWLDPAAEVGQPTCQQCSDDAPHAANGSRPACHLPGRFESRKEQGGRRFRGNKMTDDPDGLGLGCCLALLLGFVVAAIGLGMLLRPFLPW